jgi:hypothetical protein
MREDRNQNAPVKRPGSERFEDGNRIDQAQSDLQRLETCTCRYGLISRIDAAM